MKSAIGSACALVGIQYEKIADYKNAIKYYELAIKFGYFDSYDNLGNLYMTKLNDKEKAKLYFELECSKQSSYSCFSLGFLYEETNNLKDTAKYYSLVCNFNN